MIHGHQDMMALLLELGAKNIESLQYGCRRYLPPKEYVPEWYRRFKQGNAPATG